MSLFRRDEVPERNTPDCPASPLRPEKVFEGSKGRFFKNAPGRVWDSVPQREKSSLVRQGTPLQAGRSPYTKHRQTVRLRLHEPKKVFEGSKGRFFKSAPLAERGTASHKERASQPSGCAFSGGTKSRHETPTDCPASPLRPEKVFEGSKGRFFKNAPWKGVGQRPTERKVKPCSTGHAFSGRSKSLHETPTDRSASPSRT